MSDNAETREAAAHWLARHLVHGFNGSQVLCQCREGGWLTRQGYMDDLLAALPPVAGPEVRPDETPAPRDRAATDVECGMWAERIRQITATWPTPLGGSEAWEIARYAVLPHLAAPAPAPGDQGLRMDEVTLLRLIVNGDAPHHQRVYLSEARGEVCTRCDGRWPCLTARYAAALASPAPAATEVGEGER